MRYIIYFGVCALIMYIVYLHSTTYNIEGYESLMACKKQGYAHDFCIRVPIQSMITTAPDLHE